ncbi:MAG: radical SAM protein [Candidatus Omnitrophota bacterium]
MILDLKEKRKRFLLRVAGVRQGKVYVGPETVHFHLTNKCNLRCQFCWAHAPGSEMHGHPLRQIALEKFERIIHDCNDLKVEAVHLSAEGEPTQHPRFSQMMALLDRMPFFVKLLTNGTFSVAQRRDVYRADEVVINLGAVDRTGYSVLHGKDYFERVIDNAHSLTRFRDRYKKSMSIKILFVKNKMNLGVLPEMRLLAKKLGVVLFEKDMMPTRQNEKIRLRGKALKNLQAQVMPPCYYGWFYASITHQDDVSLCCYIYNTGEVNIERMSFKEAWFSAPLMRLRLEAARGSLHKKFLECRSCPAAMRGFGRRPPLWGIVPEQSAQRSSEG